MQLIILDRDGVINHDSNEYVKSPEEWVPITGSLEAIARLCRADYKVVVITNQSGIGRELFSLDMLVKINTRMLEHIRQKGGDIDAILFCPHTPEQGCNCRKPKPGMFLELAQRLKVNLDGVFAVGDSMRDLEASKAAGCVPVLVRTGNGQQTEQKLKGTFFPDDQTISVFDHLSSFVDQLLLNQHGK